MTGIVFGPLRGVNFGPFGSFEMGLAERGLVAILGENKDTSSADSNGAGKSHILKALTWCLFGDTVEGDKGDKVIRHGEKAVEVSVGWTDADGEWSVTRAKTRGSASSLVFTHNNQDISGQTQAQTQVEINRKLGLDYPTWRNTVMYAQGDLVRFADPGTTDTDRKAILKRILRLEVWDKACDGAKAKVKVVETALAALRAESATIAAELRGLGDGAELTAQAEQAEAEADGHDKKAKALPRWRKLVDGIKAEVAKLNKARAEAQAIYNQAQAQANKLRADASRHALTVINPKVAAAQTRAGEHETVAALAAAAAERAEADIAAFEAGVCPTCQAPATAEHIQTLLADLAGTVAVEREAEATALADAQAARSEAAAAQRSATEHVAQTGAEADRLLREAAATLKAATDSIAAELGQWTDKERAASREVAIGEQAIAAAGAARRRALGLRAQLKKLDERRGLLVARDGEIVAEVAELDKQKLHWEYWVRGFSNSGLPSFMMDSAVPDLSERANHYLDILADGDIKVQLDTQSKLKSGDSREKLSINWTIEGLPDVTPSGGQRKKISIAVGLAMMDLVASRERSSIDLLLMDEVLDGLDATGKSRIMSLLTELRAKRSSIFVISHDAGIAELFEHAVTVRKEGAVAVLVDETEAEQ